MDTQRRKGVLEICVLAVLQRGPSYGYKIVRDVSACIPMSESTLYSILRRLEGSGCVSTYTEAHQGRLRRYYCIEPPGREKIRSFLGEAAEMRRIYAFVEEASS